MGDRFFYYHLILLCLPYILIQLPPCLVYETEIYYVGKSLSQTGAARPYITYVMLY